MPLNKGKILLVLFMLAMAGPVAVFGEQNGNQDQAATEADKETTPTADEEKPGKSKKTLSPVLEIKALLLIDYIEFY